MAESHYIKNVNRDTSAFCNRLRYWDEMLHIVTLCHSAHKTVNIFNLPIFLYYCILFH